MSKPLVADGTIDSVDRGAKCHTGVAGGFSDNGRRFIVIAPDEDSLADLMETVFKDFTAAREKFVPVVVVGRKHANLEGEEL